VDLARFLSGSFTFVDAEGREVRDSEWLERVSKSPALENTR
jgi:hypothetical protein